MKKIYLTSLIIFSIFIISGCQTVKNKTDAIVEKENQKLSYEKITEMIKDSGYDVREIRNVK